MLINQMGPSKDNGLGRQSNNLQSEFVNKEQPSTEIFNLKIYCFMWSSLKASLIRSKEFNKVGEIAVQYPYYLLYTCIIINIFNVGECTLLFNWPGFDWKLKSIITSFVCSQNSMYFSVSKSHFISQGSHFLN